MTVSELINLPSQRVRRDSDLMAFYIEAFKEKFGKVPACAGCTFSTDFLKLKKAVEKGDSPKIIITMEKKESTFKLYKRQGKILSYRKDGRTIRQYDNKMTEDFAVGYLTYGTKEEIDSRKKLFRILPEEIDKKKKPEVIVEEVKEVPSVKEILTVEPAKKTRKPRTKKAK